MHNIHRLVSKLSSATLSVAPSKFLKESTTPGFRSEASQLVRTYGFSSQSGSGGKNEGPDEWENAAGGSFSQTGSDDLGWDSVSSWSTGLTKDHFNGEMDIEDKLKELDAENRKGKFFVDGWGERLRETSVLLKQVEEPGARGSYLKDSEKAEMYRLHKENPEVYTIEKLAKDYRIMKQRVHAILWLKEDEEEERKRGRVLDDSVELLLDTCPE
ncbi:Protein GAMETE CELL DEFECTIVE 1, mitochondrial [Linum perenne]